MDIQRVKRAIEKEKEREERGRDDEGQAKDLLQQMTVPSIATLVDKYPKLRHHGVKRRKIGSRRQDDEESSGSMICGIDYKKPDAVYEMSHALFKEFLDLDVHLDRTHLCPRPANRTAYVLWIHQLISETAIFSGRETDAVYGLDIGVGASCVYPLIACSLYKEWHMIGTDILDRSLERARENVQRNGLEERITLLRVEDGSNGCQGEKGSGKQGYLIPQEVFDVPKAKQLSFTMCNPPFYSDREEMDRLGRTKMTQPWTERLVAQDNELFTAGGEVLFIERHIEDSIRLGKQVQWYTTLVGRMESLLRSVETIKQRGIQNYAIHEVYSEHASDENHYPANTGTRRWLLAWSLMNARPRMDTMRAHSAKLKTRNALATEMVFKARTGAASNSDSANSGSTTMAIKVRLQELEVEVETLGNTLIVHCDGDKWTRTFRRTGRTSVQDDMWVRIDVQENGVQVRVWWMYGREHKLFESFCGLIQRTVSLN